MSALTDDELDTLTLSDLLMLSPAKILALIADLREARAERDALRAENGGLRVLVVELTNGARIPVMLAPTPGCGHTRDLSERSATLLRSILAGES